MFILTCPFCRQKFSAENEWIGQQASCPGCNQTITITHPYKNRSFLMIAIGVPGVAILFFILMIIGLSCGWFGDTLRDSYFDVKYALLNANRTKSTNQGIFSSSRLVRITANGYPKYSARYEIYVNGALAASSDETSGYWNTRMSLKDSDTMPKFCLKMGMAPSEKLNTPIKQQSVHHPLLIWKLQNIENHE